MSANVWFEEVDTGLLAEIQNTVRVFDASNTLVALPNTALMVRKPEEEFKPESYPCISIYNVTSNFDVYRYSPQPVEISRDTVNHISVMEEPCVPFNLLYQIDFWAQYSTDINNMTISWLKNHFRQFNLNVIDDGGTQRSCNCILATSPRKSDLILNGERLFHTIITYRIWVEIDSETRYNVNTVIDRNIDANETEDNTE